MCPARCRLAMHSAYARVRRLEVPARPGREPQERRGRCRARGGRPRGRGRAPAGRARCVPATSPSTSACPARWTATDAGSRRNSSSSTTTMPGGRSPGPRPSADMASSHRSASRRRASTPSISPVDSSDPAYALLSTGRTRSSSSGSASSQRRSVRLLPAPLQRRAPPARPGPPRARSPRRPARGRIASARSPFCSYHSLARRCRSGTTLGLLVEQARAQHVGEEVVVAVPPAAVVERDQEQVAALQRLQHGLAAVLAGDGIAQRAAQPVQDGGLQQEVLDVARAGAAGPPRPGSRRCSGRPRRSRR